MFQEHNISLRDVAGYSSVTVQFIGRMLIMISKRQADES